MVTGYPPFLGESEYIVFTKSLEQDPKFPEVLFQGSPDLKDLILQMMKKQMQDRLTIEQAKKHKFWEGTTWEKLPTFQESLGRVSGEDKFLIKAKQHFLKQEQTYKSNKSLYESDFAMWAKQIDENQEFTEPSKSYLRNRLRFM